MYRELLIPVVLVSFLAACASDTLVKGGQQQKPLDAAMSEIIRLREPCVDSVKWPNAGPDHPLCAIDDKKMLHIAILTGEYRSYLGRALTAVEEGRTIDAEGHLANAELMLQDIILMQLSASVALNSKSR